MKRKTLPALLVSILIVTSSCFMKKELPAPSQVIAHVTDTTRIKGSSLVYALPRTMFTISVNMERTIEIPGPYAAYADELLGLGNVIRSEGEQWSIRSIAVNVHTEADPSEYYIIESDGIFISNVLALRREGLILDLNPESDHQSGLPVNSKESEAGNFRSFDLGSDEYYQVQSDTAFKRVTMDSSFIRLPYIVEKKKKLTKAQLAERTARRLMELREGKILILTGEANVFPQDESAVKEMNRLEKDYTELFTGKIFKESRTFTYQVIPEKGMSENPVTLFRFSEITGPEEITAKSGDPVIFSLSPEQKTKDVTMISGQQGSTLTRSDRLFYRIPDVVNLKITLGNEILHSSRKLVYQFGEVVQLPGNYVIGK